MNHASPYFIFMGQLDFQSSQEPGKNLHCFWSIENQRSIVLITIHTSCVRPLWGLQKAVVIIFINVLYSLTTIGTGNLNCNKWDTELDQLQSVVWDEEGQEERCILGYHHFTSINNHFRGTKTFTPLSRSLALLPKEIVIKKVPGIELEARINFWNLNWKAN